MKQHQLHRCPKAPLEIRAARPTRLQKFPRDKIRKRLHLSNEPLFFHLADTTANNFLQIESIENKLRFLEHLDTHERKALFRQLADSGGSIGPTTSPDLVDIALNSLDATLFKELALHPDLLYTVSPRRFEEIVAGILTDRGCDVCLTPQTRDGGRDILALFPAPFGRLLVLVECKRYAPDRPIGIDVVERFLWIVTQKDRASFGLLATTSYFSRDAQALAKEYRYQLDLKDFAGVTEWIGQYGRWTETDESGLWLPKNSQRPKSKAEGVP